MTTLYRHILIESAEQAEALPDGTIATVEEDPAPYYKFDGRWHWGADGGFAARSPVGMTALVPIEAEEVHVTARGLLELDMHGRPDVNHDVADARPYRRTEYRTPWEEA